MSKLSVFMRPQRIVSNLSVNVIIHLEVKLNYEKILENGWISKVKRAPVISLIAKSKESDTDFMAEICMYLPPFEAKFESKLPLFKRKFYIILPLIIENILLF